MILLRCYPRITDFIYHFFNEASWADFRFLPIYSYGFFVACGFFAAATLAVKEMKRREALGLLKGQEQEVTIGEAPSVAETIFYGIFGFILGFKVLGLVAYKNELSAGALSIGDFMFSASGSWVGGILAGAGLAGYFYWSKNKQKLAQPEKKKIATYPSDGIGDLVVIAAVLGVLGSNLFNYLENPGDYADFWSNPLGSLFSGLSVYGGLICAGVGFGLYAWRKKFSILHFFDSVAPGFILANGIGRIGCQVSGDGDWGLANPYTKPSWFPQFMWSDSYAYHIVNCDPTVDVPIPNCIGEENCCQLAHAAYPTPIYEFLMCTVIFFILWSIRKKVTYKPGMVFFIFMILIGIQRYAIEQWRDLSGRDTYHFFGAEFRQSEIISIIMVTIGVGVTAWLWNKYKGQTNTI
jgi:prolipoprotein diacylglyceryltransferase